MAEKEFSAAAQRLFRAILVQAIQDSKEKDLWVVEVTEQSKKLGTFSAVAFASTVEEGVIEAQTEIREQRPRYRGKIKVTVRAAKLSDEAEDFIMTERSDLHVMSQGITNVDAFRSGMQERMSAPVLTVFAENGRHNAKFISEGVAAA